MEPTPARPIRRSLRVAGMTPMQPAKDYILRTTLAPPSVAAIATPSKRVAGGASEAAYRALLPPTAGRNPPAPLLGSYYISPAEDAATHHSAAGPDGTLPQPSFAEPLRPGHRSPQSAQKRSPAKSAMATTRQVPRHVPAAAGTVRARRLFAQEPPPETMPVAQSLAVTLSHAARLYWQWFTGALFVVGGVMLVFALASLDWRPDISLGSDLPDLDVSPGPDRVFREAHTINGNFRALRDQVLRLEDAVRQVGTMAVDGDARLGRMIDDTAASVLKLQESTGCTARLELVESALQGALETAAMAAQRADAATEAITSVSLRLDSRFAEAMVAIGNCSARAEERISSVVSVFNQSNGSVEERIAAAINSPTVASALAAKVAALVPERVVGPSDAAALRHIVVEEVAAQRRALDEASVKRALDAALDVRLRSVPDRAEVQRLAVEAASRVEQRVESVLASSAFEITPESPASQSHPAESMADYALLSMGARPDEAATSPPFVPRPSHWLFGSWAARMATHTPDVALVPDTAPGACWAFAGSTGHYTVLLGTPVRPSHVTVDHVAPLTGLDRRSAPRGIRVLADGALLAEIEYRLDGPPAQTFAVQRPAEAVSAVRFEFLSNHGRSEYTCVYRLRVHAV